MYSNSRVHTEYIDQNCKKLMSLLCVQRSALLFEVTSTYFSTNIKLVYTQLLNSVYNSYICICYFFHVYLTFSLSLSLYEYMILSVRCLHSFR